MMKNLWKTVVCAAAATLAVSSACFAEGTFKVGFESEFPPYSYMDVDGEYVGFDVDLAKAVAELEGWEFIPAPIVWDSRDDVLASGEIDCIWSGFTINGREDDYAWSVPYVKNSVAVLVKSDSGIGSLADLAGKTVGIQSASSSLDLISEGGAQADFGASLGRIWQFPNTTNAFVALINNNVDAVVNDIGVANYYVGVAEGYTILSEYLSDDELYGIAFSKEDEELRDTVNEALTTLTENGTVAEIAAKYNLTDLVVLDGTAPAAEADTEAETADAEAVSEAGEAGTEAPEAATEAPATEATEAETAAE